MSAIPKPVEPARQQHMTEEDGDAMFKSLIWFEKQRGARKLLDYQKMWVAVLGEQIIDADRSEEELNRRIAALGDSINQFRVLVRYLRGSDELYE
jgi:hypothetical protein